MAQGPSDLFGGNKMRILNAFAENEDGAVTVDWVVLTAGVIGITLAALSVMTSGTQQLTETISSDVAARSVSAAF